MKNIIVKIALIICVMMVVFGVIINTEKVMEENAKIMEEVKTETRVSAYEKYENAIREDFPKLLSKESNGMYTVVSQDFDWHEDQSITWTITAYNHEMESWEMETVEIPGPANLVLYQAEISEQISS